MQEYYFYKDKSQIHGTARMPARLTPASEPGRVPGLSSLGERRNRCVALAVQDAQARFLAVTREDQQEIAEWKARLAMGARRGWGSCFDEAVMRSVFFEPPDQCRVVMVFPCSPREF